MPTYDRDRQGREWEREQGGGRQGYGRERPDYERGRQPQGAGGRWEQERGPWGYSGGREGREWPPPAYRWRQQEYPWGQQGQEGYFGGGRPGRAEESPRRGWERPASEWQRERQGTGWERQGRGWERPEYERERRSWGAEYRSRQGERPDYEGESEQRGVGGLGWDQRGYSGWEGEGVRGPHAGRGPKGYQRSDARLHEDICDRLTEHPAIDASEIEVEVQGCEVTLRGTVESRAVKHLAETMAETVPGVREIHNQLRVARGQQSGQPQASQEGQSGRTTT
jgi:hypothetical protein